MRLMQKIWKVNEKRTLIKSGGKLIPRNLILFNVFSYVELYLAVFLSKELLLFKSCQSCLEGHGLLF